MPLVISLACLLGFFFPLTLCVDIGHLEFLGGCFSCCGPKLGGGCHCHLWNYSAFRGVGLRVLYLAEGVRCQLVGEDALQVLMDPLVFMLALHSMMDAEYQLWRSVIPYTQQVSDELDYEEFNDTRLMPSLTLVVCVLPSHSFPSFLCTILHNDVYTGYSYSTVPTTGAPIDPPRLLWSVYVYSLDGFAYELLVGRKTNVMG